MLVVFSDARPKPPSGRKGRRERERERRRREREREMGGGVEH